MIIRSIYILQYLDHPTVVKFVNYIISPDDSTIYLIFECAKKGSLRSLMEPLHSRPSLGNYVLYQLAQALAYLKSKNVAHRDIKVSPCRYSLLI